MDDRSEYGSEDEENADEGGSFEERKARFAEPIAPFTETLTEWQHPHTHVWFANPTPETNPDTYGVLTEVVVWEGQCVADGCSNTFLVAHRLPPPGYPPNMPTPRMMRGLHREHCDFHVRGVKPNLPPEKRPPLHAFTEKGSGRRWEPAEYRTQTLLTGREGVLGVWDSECIVPDCGEFVEYVGVARENGTPMRLSARKPEYCETHKFGRGGRHPATPKQAAWFKERNKGRRDHWLTVLKAGREKAAQNRKEKYENASPEERLQLAALKKEQMKPWLEACAAGREKRKAAYVAATPEEQVRIRAEGRAKIKPWLEACAKGRVLRSAAYQAASPEKQARMLADALAVVNATHGTPAKPKATASAPPVTASAPPPTAAEVEGVRARREANAVYNLLAAHTAPATPTPENISPEYLALYRWVAKRIGKEPVFGIKTPPPTPADASAIVALFERMPLAVTLEWEGAWRMAHRVVKNLHTDRQLANREEARVNVREQAFNDAFGWQPGHNCYWRPTEEKLLEKALKESKPELVRASATLDRVRKQVEELPVRALTEDVAQAEVDLMAQEIEAEEALARVQERRKPMQDRKAEFDAEKKAAEQKHKREMAEAEEFRKIDAAERAANPPKAKTADDENSYYE